MSAHPGLRPAQTPDRDLLARAQQSGEEHRRVAQDAEGETPRASAARTESPSAYIAYAAYMWLPPGSHQRSPRTRADECDPGASLTGRRGGVLRHELKERIGIYAMSRIVRAGVNTTWLRVVMAQIAGGGLFLSHHRHA